MAAAIINGRRLAMKIVSICLNTVNGCDFRHWWVFGWVTWGGALKNSKNEFFNLLKTPLKGPNPVG